MKRCAHGVFVLVVVAASFGWPPRALSADNAVREREQETAAVAAILPAVVRIEAVRLSPNQGRMVKSSVTGSGVIFTPAGHVLTNFHVADNAELFVCHLNDGDVLPARRIGQDALTDLAVLQFDLRERCAEAGTLPVAMFGDSDRLQAGEVVFAVGSPASPAETTIWTWPSSVRSLIFAAGNQFSPYP